LKKFESDCLSIFSSCTRVLLNQNQEIFLHPAIKTSFDVVAEQKLVVRHSYDFAKSRLTLKEYAAFNIPGVSILAKALTRTSLIAFTNSKII